MKIIDCTSFYNEHMMYEVRLNVLKDKVDKFIVTESTYSHSGKKKKLNFDINNYPKFKDKIKYIVIDKEPDGIVEENNNPTLQRANSLKRIEQSESIGILSTHIYSDGALSDLISIPGGVGKTGINKQDIDDKKYFIKMTIKCL